MKKCKYLIIGAGVSGLSFAGKKIGEDYIIIEKEDQPGGLCKTTRRNGYVWDYSGHFFNFNNKEYGVFIGVGKDKLPYIKNYNLIVIDAQYYTKQDIIKLKSQGNKKIFS